MIPVNPFTETNDEIREDDGPRLTRRIVRAVSLPATLAHEITHLAASAPWAEQCALVLDGDEASLRVDWQDDAPWWGIWMAAYAPMILGSLVGLIGLVQLAVATPSSPTEWLLAGALAGYWTIYVVPSAADRETARSDTDT